ncbi:MAG: DNA mismatch repair protein MutS [Blastocatellia bacterium]
MPPTDKPLTPMLRQYHEIKKQHPGTLLFFRLGDFYELFYDDALIASREMEITLTARHKETGSPVPMCGVPYHAASSYIAKLVRKGFRVAICDQTEEVSAAKKLVKREVVRIITPGTALESQLLESKQNNYLAAMCGAGEGMGFAVLDLSTGEFLATEFRGEGAWNQVIEQLEIFTPKELLFPASLAPLLRHAKQVAPFAATVPAQPHSQPKEKRSALSASGSIEISTLTYTPLDDWLFGFEHAEGLLQVQLNVATLDGFGLAGKQFAVCAAGAILHYVNETQRAQAGHLSEITYFESSESLHLDATTLANLEIVESHDKNKLHSLLGVLDDTMTGMGARLLRQWLLRPSVRLSEIEMRLNTVAELKQSNIKRDQLRQLLESFADLERLAGKITLGRIAPRELLSLLRSIESFPALRQQLTGCQASLLVTLAENFDDLGDLGDEIRQALADDPPATATEPGIIRTGFNHELDELRSLATSGKSYIAAIEARERGRTGIASLKVKFNNVFGYFIEISHTNRDKVPADYERKQTLVNAERYTTPELKEYEIKVLGAEERILELETALFKELRLRLAQHTKRLQNAARVIALLDVTSNLAEVAARRGYTRPQLHEGDEVEIRQGRHPIVETFGERFIPNDLLINNTTDRLLIITGPNMGGKSVYLKQAALICILAQIGSFVPATAAKLAILDRVFTRVGASDNLASGRSTFMVEMTETANILNTATPRSLILLDEVGRGTATFDGLSLAWAIAEYIHDHPHHSAKTLFATHYHEMTELAKLRPGVRNYQVAISERNGEIVFLRRVIEGSASKSYGIEVARLAGLPRTVVERAREILANLEQNELDLTGKPKFARHLKKPSAKINQLSFFSENAENDSP